MSVWTKVWQTEGGEIRKLQNFGLGTIAVWLATISLKDPKAKLQSHYDKLVFELKGTVAAFEAPPRS